MADLSTLRRQQQAIRRAALTLQRECEAFANNITGSETPRDMGELFHLNLAAGACADHVYRTADRIGQELTRLASTAKKAAKGVRHG